MTKRLVTAFVICSLMLSLCNAFAKDTRRSRIGFMRTMNDEALQRLVDPGLRELYTSAQVDTYHIVSYDFEGSDWQGWTRLDLTAQRGVFFHVDDFSGLGGGDYGGLVPIEGEKSMWCGARPGTDTYMCSWISAPGYGHDWIQILVTDPFSFVNPLVFSYSGHFDSEPGYDYTYVEYDAGGGRWQELDTYDGVVNTTATHLLITSLAQTKLRFRFVSDGGFDDIDDWYNSDGAAIVDSITISDAGGLNDYENFESANFGDHDAGMWHAEAGEAYGMYSGLRGALTDQDPCNENFTTQVVFFVGSPYPSATYPGLYDTPFCKGAGGIEFPCQTERIVSPVIDLTKYSTNNDENQDGDIPPGDLLELGGNLLRFTVYRHLPPENNVFWLWHYREIDEYGCPGEWRHYWTFYYGGAEGEFSFREEDFIVESDRIQLALGVSDICWWNYEPGYCAEHTPSPWFDNVRLCRYKKVGPQWGFWPGSIFQDSFPEDEFDLESYVRADIGKDTGESEAYRPGDSAVVHCESPIGGGIAEDAGGARVYCHVRCTDLRPTPRPNLYGPQLEGTYGNYISDDGAVWTIIQCDTAYMWGAPIGGFSIDLNDSLFTRGYMIEYYFKAYDNAGESSTLPERAESHGRFFEWTCLPTGKSDILYVDDASWPIGGLAQTFFDPAFEAVLTPENQPDRYDVNHPSGLESNGPGNHAKNFHLTSFYRKIIWDSGRYSFATIADGTSNSDKSNDCQMLVDWMNLSEHDVGLLVCGDDIAYDLDQHLTSTQALDLMSNWCGVSYLNKSYYQLTGGNWGGGITYPLVTGAPSGIFWHGGTPDQFPLWGGCPSIGTFDVLETAGNGVAALLYPDYGGESYIAGIQSERTNSADYTVRTMWLGFSYYAILNPDLTSPVMRNEILKDVVDWFGNLTNDNITATDMPRAYSLAQNFPNPFNPSTTIKFDMKAKGNVTIKVYNAAGQLVRTLVDCTKDAGTHTVIWNGTNNGGAEVASGVYFYRMETKEFSSTKKLVMLR